MCLCWKGLGKLLTDRPAWQNRNVCHQLWGFFSFFLVCFFFFSFFLPITCKHCPHDLCLFWHCHQLTQSNQNVHLPCLVPFAFSVCFLAICLFCNTVLLEFLFLTVCSTGSFKSRKPCFSARFL